MYPFHSSPSSLDHDAFFFFYYSSSVMILSSILTYSPSFSLFSSISSSLSSPSSSSQVLSSGKSLLDVLLKEVEKCRIGRDCEEVIRKKHDWNIHWTTKRERERGNEIINLYLKKTYKFMLHLSMEKL